MNIPIIGEKEQPKFPMKKIDVLPDGAVVIQILIAPDIITSTIVLTHQDMTAIDQLRVSMRMQQRQELQLVKNILETKS